MSSPFEDALVAAAAAPQSSRRELQERARSAATEAEELRGRLDLVEGLLRRWYYMGDRESPVGRDTHAYLYPPSSGA